MSSTPALEIKNLEAWYGESHVLHGVDMVVQPGEVVTLLGRNGAGKSTTLKTIAGVIAPDGGEVWIEGHSLAQAPQVAKARLAYVPDNCLASPQQTGRGLLEQVAAEKGVAVDDAVLDLAARLGLEPHLDKRFEQMSTGTRRKVYLTAAALGDPAVVVADGPSNGLDAQARGVLADVFKTWGQTRVVLFASHDPELVQACGARTVNVTDLR